MDAVYARGEASVADVQTAMSDPPSYSAVRALMRILVEKGHLKHKNVGGKYVYFPTHPRRNVGKSALRRVLATFYENSTSKALAALLEFSDRKLSDDELDELAELIQQAKRKGKSR